MTFVLNAAAVVLRFEAKIEGLVGLTRCELNWDQLGMLVEILLTELHVRRAVRLNWVTLCLGLSEAYQ